MMIRTKRILLIHWNNAQQQMPLFIPAECRFQMLMHMHIHSMQFAGILNFE